jgi:hypothetical protein
MDDFVVDISAYEGMQSMEVQNLETGDAEESSLGKTVFGKYRYFHIPVEYAKGDPGFPLPGVYNDRYDTATQTSVREPGPYMVKGMKLATGKKFVNILVVEQTDKNGRTFHRVDQHPGFTDLWKDYQWPAIKENAKMLTATGARAIEAMRAGKNWTEINALPGVWVYGKSSLVKSPLKRAKQDGTEGDTYYRTDFVFYGSEAEMKKVETEFWAERGGGSTNGSAPQVDLSRFPVMWAKSSGMPDALYAKINKEMRAGKSAREAAVASMLMSKDGAPMANADGQPVDVAWIFGQALGMPAEMFTF